MTDNITLDAAIEAAGGAIQGKGWSPRSRTYARALIAKLLEGITDEENDSYSSGFNAVLTEIRRRAGLPD